MGIPWETSHGMGWDGTNGGFRVGGPEASLKIGGPLMTSSYSANRDNHFWSSVRYGHSRIRSWDYGITDVAEGENAKGCSWYTTLKTLKVGFQSISCIDTFMKMLKLNRKKSFSCLWVEKVRQISHFLWCCTLVNISIRKWNNMQLL